MFAALKKAVLQLGRWVGGAIKSAIDPVRSSARGLVRDSVRVLKEYVELCFNPARPHQGLEQRIPRLVSKPTSGATDAEIIEAPVLNGLHHVYEWAA